jgi:hypothetical protein
VHDKVADKHQGFMERQTEQHRLLLEAQQVPLRVVSSSASAGALVRPRLLLRVRPRPLLVLVSILKLFEAI